MINDNFIIHNGLVHHKTTTFSDVQVFREWLAEKLGDRRILETFEVVDERSHILPEILEKHFREFMRTNNYYYKFSSYGYTDFESFFKKKIKLEGKTWDFSRFSYPEETKTAPNWRTVESIYFAGERIENPIFSVNPLYNNDEKYIGCIMDNYGIERELPTEGILICNNATSEQYYRLMIRLMQGGLKWSIINPNI